MSAQPNQLGVASGRLDGETLTRNFADLHPPLTGHEAAVAADRCYFCYDAPCVTACPTAIDIPLFIRQIATGQPREAGRTILDQNILGGMCARVCPTETLCEQACVREAAEGRPVEIGRLQRFATDRVMEETEHPYSRAPSSGKSAAVVGTGPAGLAAAHRLAMRGHDVTLYEARRKGGGLSEFGIAAYKTVDDFAQREFAWLLDIGGIEVCHCVELGAGLVLYEMLAIHDAVFLGLGLGRVNRLPEEGMNHLAVRDAVQWIARLRQSPDLSDMPVGRRVVVIGGGMTAIDAAVQSRLLGAEEVTIAYRGPRERMRASDFEQNLALSRGVRILCGLQPVEVHDADDGVAVRFEDADGGERQIEADQVLYAIGQRPGDLPPELETVDGRIKVDSRGRTSVDRVWAGGDCVAVGDDLTVTAVAQGRDAAEDMHEALSSGAAIRGIDHG